MIGVRSGGGSGLEHFLIQLNRKCRNTAVFGDDFWELLSGVALPTSQTFPYVFRTYARHTVQRLRSDYMRTIFQKVRSDRAIGVRSELCPVPKRTINKSDRNTIAIARSTLGAYV